MTNRKTLNLRDTPDAEAPELKKKGRGWGILEKRLDASEAQKLPAISLEGSVG